MDPMGLFRNGDKATRTRPRRGPVATGVEDGDDDATPPPLARHAAPEPDKTLLAPPPPPTFQAAHSAETSLNAFSEPNTTGRNRTRTRGQNESQIQHIRTEEVIDILKSDEEMELDDLPRDLRPRDEYTYMNEVVELEEKCNKQSEAMEGRLAEMNEDIRVIEL